MAIDGGIMENVIVKIGDKEYKIPNWVNHYFKLLNVDMSEGFFFGDRERIISGDIVDCSTSDKIDYGVTIGNIEFNAMGYSVYFPTKNINIEFRQQGLNSYMTLHYQNQTVVKINLFCDVLGYPWIVFDPDMIDCKKTMYSFSYLDSYDSGENYLERIASKIDLSMCDEFGKTLIHTMLTDPRLCKALENLLSGIPKDLEEAKAHAIEKIDSIRDSRISEAIKTANMEHDSDLQCIVSTALKRESIILNDDSMANSFDSCVQKIII